MKKLIISALILIPFIVSAQVTDSLWGTRVIRIGPSSTTIGHLWTGTSGSDSVFSIFQNQMRAYKPFKISGANYIVLGGGYTFATLPTASTCNACEAWTTDSLQPYYSNGTGWFSMKGGGGGSGGTPGGSNTQFQYNNSSTFAGFSGLTTDGTNLFAPAIVGSSSASSTMTFLASSNGSPTTEVYQFGGTSGLLYNQLATGGPYLSVGIAAGAQSSAFGLKNTTSGQDIQMLMEDNYSGAGGGNVNDNYIDAFGKLGLIMSHNYNPHNGTFLNEASGGNQSKANVIAFGGSSVSYGLAAYSFNNGSSTAIYSIFIPFGTHNVIIGGGSSPTNNAAVAFSVQSTTQASVPAPVMTTTQQNAISTPLEGSRIYDNVLHAPAYYSGTSWISMAGFYNADGTLSGNRTVTQSNNSLTFTGGQAAFVGSSNWNPGANIPGSRFEFLTGTLTDNVTAASGTVTNAVVMGVSGPLIAATNTGVNVTNAYTLLINGPPQASTNVTLTNGYSLGVVGPSSFGGNVFTGNLMETTTPTIAAGTGAGTSPTISISGSNQSGLITITTGTAPTLSAVIATITYGGGIPFKTGSYPVLFPANAATALLSGTSMVFTTGSTTNFTMTAGTVALTGTTVYSWYFKVGAN